MVRRIVDKLLEACEGSCTWIFYEKYIYIHIGGRKKSEMSAYMITDRDRAWPYRSEGVTFREFARIIWLLCSLWRAFVASKSEKRTVQTRQNRLSVIWYCRVRLYLTSNRILHTVVCGQRSGPEVFIVAERWLSKNCAKLSDSCSLYRALACVHQRLARERERERECEGGREKQAMGVRQNR